ncbi:PEBP family protein [Chelatococcus composti]|nr:PEBP family protein [Chelatococcus composti]
MAMALMLTSPAFADGERIPRSFARDGENLMPPLRWTGVPEGAGSLVLVVEDPDAPSGTFYHLGVYNIPPNQSGLSQAADAGPSEAMRFARNDFGNTGYDGPQPPPGHGVHHYHFRLAAISQPHLDISGAAGVAEVWAAAQRHLLEETVLIGTYER